MACSHFAMRHALTVPVLPSRPKCESELADVGRVRTIISFTTSSVPSMSMSPRSHPFVTLTNRA